MRSVNSFLRPILTSKIMFCIALALIMVGCRLAFFDFHYFFLTKSIPNHDMYQGAPFWATSMHSIRLSGDIAWWNPLSYTGYAQYYQSFFGPLAPTPGHIVFIMWGQMVRVLSTLGIAIPEYYQYLIVNYVVLSFLTFLAFSLFLTLLYRRRTTMVLVLSAYVLSGIGIWYSSWFYFQESFTLFLLLTTAIAFLRQTTLPRLFLLIAAALIQLASLNYWTLYNSAFILIILGAYCWAYPEHFRQAIRRVRVMFNTHRLVSLAGMALVMATALVWIVILGSIAREQLNANVRTIYSIEAARKEILEIRNYTTEFFNPDIIRAMQYYPAQNPAHNARYIGLTLFPLLVFIPLYRWRRREIWLVASVICVLIICFSPIFLLILWQVFPMMNRIIHFFYFYTHFFQILLVLLAGHSFETMFWLRTQPQIRQRMAIVLVGLATVALLILIGCNVFSQLAPLKDVSLNANIYSALLILITCVLLLQILFSNNLKTQRLMVFFLLLLTLSDLANYFNKVNLQDNFFTRTLWTGFEPSLPDGIQMAFRHPWKAPDLTQGFKAGLFDNMPYTNDFWPNNEFMLPTHQFDLRKQDSIAQVLKSPDVSFYSGAVVASIPETVAQVKDNTTFLTQRLVLHEQPDPALLSVEVQEIKGFTYEWKAWGYNDFKFDVTSPEKGWLLIHQLADPLWKIQIDNQPVKSFSANIVYTALPLTAGSHEITMSYRPLARQLYGFGIFLLEACLLILTISSGVLYLGQERLWHMATIRPETTRLA